MTNTLDTVGSSRGDRRRSRAYLREFVPAMAAYVLVLGSVLLWGGIGGHSAWRFLWALLPAVPAVAIVWAVIRHMRRIDEYQRRVQLEGFAVGFAAAMVASVTSGLLAVAGLVLLVTPWIIYGVGMLGWVVGAAIAARR